MRTLCSHSKIKRFAAIMLLAVLMLALLPVSGFAADTRQTVRVGWYTMDGMQETSSLGRKSGYGYEYLQDIAAANGWKYEYVACEKAETAQLLKTGKIDLVCCMAKTGADDAVRFSRLPMATASVYIYTGGQSSDISAADPASLNGKTVALVSNDQYNVYYEEYAAANKLKTNNEYFQSIDEAVEALQAGRTDCLAAGSMRTSDGLYPAILLGAENYYFATSDATPWVKDGVDAAMARLFASNPAYNQTLSKKYFDTDEPGACDFSPEELAWIEENPQLRVGWTSSLNPLIYEKSGTVSGPVASYINRIGKMTGLSVTYVRFDDCADMELAVDNGGIDVTAASFSDLYAAETRERLQSHVYYNAKFVLVTKGADNIAIDTVAYNSNRGSGYAAGLYPGADIEECQTDTACLDAVMAGEADCALVESYSARLLMRLEQYGDLSCVRLGETYPCCFEAAADSGLLVSILNTAIDIADSGKIDEEATQYAMDSVDVAKTQNLEREHRVAVSANELTCFIILLTIIIYILNNSSFVSKSVRAFVFTCGATMLRILGDWGNYLMDGLTTSGAVAANRVFTFMLLSSSPLMLMAYTIFVYHFFSERKKVGKILPSAAFTIAGIAIAMVLISQLNGVVYSISASNVYNRGPYYLLFTVLIISCIAVLSVWIGINHRSYSKREIAALLFAIMMPMLATLAEILWPEMNFSNPLVTVGLCGTFLTLQSTLLNREHLGRLNTLTELEGISQAFTGVYTWDEELGGMVCSVTSKEYAGLLVNDVLSIDRLCTECVHPDDRNAVRTLLSPENLRRLNAEPRKANRETEYREVGAHTGEWRRITLMHFPAEQDRHAQLYMVFHDITFEKQLVEKSAAQSRRFVGTAAGVYIDIIECYLETDTSIRLILDNGNVSETDIHGSWSEYMAKYGRGKVMPDDMDSFDKVLPKNLAKLPVGEAFTCSFRAKENGIEYRWYSITIKIFSDGRGGKMALYMQQDIDGSVREHNYLKDRSEHDAMTDLFSRAKLEEMKLGEYKTLKSCGVLFFDINNLKRTNDSLGHDAGDKIILMAAESIRSITNRRILAYRIGGDEMLVVAANANKDELDRITDLWRIRFEALNKTAEVKCSVAVGAAWAKGDFTVEELIKTADERMYENKKATKEGRAV